MIWILLIIFIFIIFIYFNYYFKENFINFHKQKLDSAIIVEPRNDPLLIKVIQNFLELLPKYTVIYIFHGTENKNMLIQHFNYEIQNGKIILIQLNKKNLTIEDYNLLLTSKDFYNKIKGENLLIFQMDTCLCSNTKYKFEDFLMYDYVGAPWINNNQKKLKNRVGNGGLSLRKKSSILYHIDNYKYNPNEPEDVYFAKSSVLKFPSVEIASQFSTEHLFNPYSMGFHKPDVHLSEKNKKIVRLTCPDYVKVFEN